VRGGRWRRKGKKRTGGADAKLLLVSPSFVDSINTFFHMFDLKP